MTKNKLAEYKAGDLSLQELRGYAQDKYVDGVKVLENIVSAFRISEEEIIASLGEKELMILYIKQKKKEMMFIIYNGRHSS
jgi:hypothetical protein